jgi:hypothetical protein
VDVAGRDQCRDVTAGHGAVIFKAQLGLVIEQLIEERQL